MIKLDLFEAIETLRAWFLLDKRGKDGAESGREETLEELELSSKSLNLIYNNNNSIFTPGTDPLRAHAGDTVRYGENLHTFVGIHSSRLLIESPGQL
jgi:hypothetical protein